MHWCVIALVCHSMLLETTAAVADHLLRHWVHACVLLCSRVKLAETFERPGHWHHLIFQSAHVAKHEMQLLMTLLQY